MVFGYDLRIWRFMNMKVLIPVGLVLLWPGFLYFYCDGLLYMTYGRKNANSKLLKPPIRKEEKFIGPVNRKFKKNQRDPQTPKEDSVDDKVTKRTAQKDSGSNPGRAEGENTFVKIVTRSEDLSGEVVKTSKAVSRGGLADKRDDRRDDQPGAEPPTEFTSRPYPLPDQTVDNAGNKVCPLKQQPAPIADHVTLAHCPAHPLSSFYQLAQGGQLSNLHEFHGVESAESETFSGWTEPESTALITTVHAEKSDQEPSLLFMLDGHPVEYYITGPRIMRIKISGLKDLLFIDQDSQNLLTGASVEWILKELTNTGNKLLSLSVISTDTSVAIYACTYGINDKLDGNAEIKSASYGSTVPHFKTFIPAMTYESGETVLREVPNIKISSTVGELISGGSQVKNCPSDLLMEKAMDHLKCLFSDADNTVYCMTRRLKDNRSNEWGCWPISITNDSPFCACMVLHRLRHYDRDYMSYQMEMVPAASSGASTLSGLHTAILEPVLYVFGVCIILLILWGIFKYYLDIFRARYPREVIEVGPDDTSLVEFQNCISDRDNPQSRRTVRATYSRGHLDLRVLPPLSHIDMSDDDFDDEEVAAATRRYRRSNEIENDEDSFATFDHQTNRSLD